MQAREVEGGRGGGGVVVDGRREEEEQECFLKYFYCRAGPATRLGAKARSPLPFFVSGLA